MADNVAARGRAPDAFEEVLRRYSAALWRLAGAYADRPDEREEIYQEILVGLWRVLPRFRGDSSERTYVYRIAHNRAITFQRKERRYVAFDDLDALSDRGPTPAEHAVARDEADRLRSAVRRLPPPWREVMTLSLEGLSNTEIAHVIGISSNNAAVRLHRARERLRVSLQATGVTDA